MLREIGPYRYSHYVAVDGPEITEKSCRLEVPFFQRDTLKAEPKRCDPDIELRNRLSDRVSDALWPFLQASQKVRVIISWHARGLWMRVPLCGFLVCLRFRREFSMAVSE